MPIIASGIGSGLDIGGLVAQLVSSEAGPANERFNAKELEYEAKLSAFGTLKGALSGFQTSLDNIQDADNFNVFIGSSSNDDVFTVSTDETAVAGSYSIEVTQLALAAKVKTADFTDGSEVMGTGTLDITLGADTFQLTIDSNNNTLEGIRDAINAATDNPGISASLITVDSGTQLILTSDTVGAANTITVAAVDDDGADGFDLTRLDSANLTTLQAATDAVIKVDGQTVTRDSNSFSDVISGVTFNLASTQVGTAETLTVTSDTEAIKTRINSFVINYNTVLGVMRGLSSFDETTNIAGALNGDSVIRSVQSRLQQTVTTAISGGSFGNLSELGITVGDDGSLDLDDTALDTALNSDLSGVKNFFSASGGYAEAFTTAISGFVDDDGIIDNREEGLESRLDSLEDKRDALTRRMAAYELRITKQFTAMDILVAQLQSTGSFLSQQLANLPSINSN